MGGEGLVEEEVEELVLVEEEKNEVEEEVVV